eukprot:6984340-Prymnesium_polylepis.1
MASAAEFTLSTSSRRHNLSTLSSGCWRGSCHRRPTGGGGGGAPGKDASGSPVAHFVTQAPAA